MAEHTARDFAEQSEADPTLDTDRSFVGSDVEICRITRDIVFVHDAVDGTEPCKPSDGTCISGVLVFLETDYEIDQTDAAEAYLLGRPDAVPLMIFRGEPAPRHLFFKIPNIPDEITDVCDLFFVGGRLDRGGNNKGRPGGPEDIILPPGRRQIIPLARNQRFDSIELVID
jgi:hypothetical protein